MLDLYEELTSIMEIKMTSGNSADMSPSAVTTRLKRTSQLRKLCLSLAKAKPLPPKPKS